MSTNVPPISGGLRSAAGSMGVELRQRHNMSLRYLRWAAAACRTVKVIEDDHKEQKYGAFFDDIAHSFAVCIMFSAAALESFLNEFMDDVGFDGEFIELIGQRRSLIDRYYYFAKLHLGATFDKGQGAAQSAGQLLRLRNALVHFKPVWDDAKKPQALEENLPKLPMSPFLDSHVIFFPMRCMTHSYAEWAVQTVYDFLDDFCCLAGHDFKLARHKADFQTT